MNNAGFDWGLVRSFLAVLDQGSLLAAARVLGATQPTLGRHVAELEAQLGVVLFERTGRGLLPTPMAQRLAADARAMESGAFALSRSATGVGASAVGAVRVTASQPVACVLLPPLLARMRLVLPETQVQLVASNAVSNLLRREADIALRMVQPKQQGLIARRLGKVTLGACAHRDYLARRGIPRAPQDLLAHDVIGQDRVDEISRGFARAGMALPAERFALRTDDLLAYWAAVRAGLGIGFVAGYLSRTDPDVLPVLPALKIPPLPMWLAVHREIRGNARIRAVYDFLAEEVPKAL